MNSATPHRRAILRATLTDVLTVLTTDAQLLKPAPDVAVLSIRYHPERDVVDLLVAGDQFAPVHPLAEPPVLATLRPFHDTEDTTP